MCRVAGCREPCPRVNFARSGRPLPRQSAPEAWGGDGEVPAPGAPTPQLVRAGRPPITSSAPARAARSPNDDI